MSELLYPNTRNYLTGQPWAILPGMLEIMAELLDSRAQGITLSREEIDARIGARRSAPASAGSIQVIPIYGVIDQKVSSMALISGGTALNALMETFRAAMVDETVSAIIFDIDSPGGSVAGIQEAASEIYAARGKKPIVAVADPMIASAAYWLASAADEIICMPSGQVGSIGVIAKHADNSKANEMEGYRPTYITYGDYKAEGNSDNPLSKDAQDYMQAQVNQFGDMFTRFVAKARGVSVDTVRSSFGQGRMLLAKDALAAGMIDSIGTLEQTIARVTKGSKATMLSIKPIADPEDGDDGDEDDDEEQGDTPITPKKVKFQESTNSALVGLNDVLARWDALVGDHALTNAKAELLQQFQAGIRDAHAKIDAIVAKVTPEEPASQSVEDGSDTEIAIEVERFKFLTAEHL